MVVLVREAAATAVSAATAAARAAERVWEG
jgi:hypothetical protein